MGIQMKRHAITFFGSGEDAHHMPVPFFFYGVLVVPAKEHAGYFYVTVVGASGAAPHVPEVPTLVKAASEEEALQMTLNTLRAHPSHKGLYVQEAPLSGPAL